MKTRMEVWRRQAAELAESDKVRALERLAEAIEGLRPAPAGAAPVPGETASGKPHAESRPKVGIPTQPPGAPLATLFDGLIANRYTTAEALAALTRLLARPGIVATPALTSPGRLLVSESGGLTVETACGNLDAREVRLHYQKLPYVPPPPVSVADRYRNLMAKQHTSAQAAEKLTYAVQSIDYEVTPLWPIVLRVRVTQEGGPIVETTDGQSDANEVFIRKLGMFEARSLSPDTRAALHVDKHAAPSVEPPGQPSEQPTAVPAKKAKRTKALSKTVHAKARDAAMAKMYELVVGKSLRPYTAAVKAYKRTAYRNPKALFQAWSRHGKRFIERMNRDKDGESR